MGNDGIQASLRKDKGEFQCVLAVIGTRDVNNQAVEAFSCPPRFLAPLSRLQMISFMLKVVHCLNFRCYCLDSELHYGSESLGNQSKGFEDELILTWSKKLQEIACCD